MFRKVYKKYCIPKNMTDQPELRPEVIEFYGLIERLGKAKHRIHMGYEEYTSRELLERVKEGKEPDMYRAMASSYDAVVNRSDVNPLETLRKLIEIVERWGLNINP